MHTVKCVIEEIYNKFPDRAWSKLFLSGKNNFRDTLATIKVYKGNRDPSNKPQYYDEIKDYLINVHKAIVVDGQEADDAQGIEQWKHKDKSTVIVGIDKDLKMIPGWHYNWVKGELEYVRMEDANAFFFMQMLIGDATDNILGCAIMKEGVYKTGKKAGQAYIKRSGVGPEEAIELLAPCNKDVVLMAQVVQEQYRKYYGEQGFMAYRENANLLWIRREENQECPF